MTCWSHICRGICPSELFDVLLLLSLLSAFLFFLLLSFFVVLVSTSLSGTGHVCLSAYQRYVKDACSQSTDDYEL